MNTFIQKMPKAELHLHLEGSIRPDTAAFLYNQLHEPIDSFQIKSMYRFDNLKSFIDGMQKVSGNIRTPQHLYRITRELLETCALQNIIYLEFDSALQKYVNLGLKLEEVVEAITQGMAEAESRFGIQSRLLVNLQRSHGAESAIELVKQVISLNAPAIVGIGLSGYEKSGDIAPFVPAFELAKNAGLHLTAHAGEVTGPESIWNAIEFLHVERVDHGTRAIDDPNLMDVLRQRQIPLTQCLSSNIHLHVCRNFNEHPFPVFYKKGMIVTLNTDDPEVFQVSLTGEYQKAAHYYHLKNQDMVNIVQNTIKASFLTPTEKNVMQHRVEQECRKLQTLVSSGQQVLI